MNESIEKLVGNTQMIIEERQKDNAQKDKEVRIEILQKILRWKHTWKES